MTRDNANDEYIFVSHTVNQILSMVLSLTYILQYENVNIIMDFLSMLQPSFKKDLKQNPSVYFDRAIKFFRTGNYLESFLILWSLNFIPSDPIFKQYLKQALCDVDTKLKNLPPQDHQKTVSCLKKYITEGNIYKYTVLTLKELDKNVKPDKNRN